MVKQLLPSECLPAFVLGIEGQALMKEGVAKVLERDTSGEPAWAVLPRGLSWCAYFAQGLSILLAQ